MELLDTNLKDYILWGGAALIGVVLLHGFWMAWRSRRVMRRSERVAAEHDRTEPMELDFPAQPAAIPIARNVRPVEPFGRGRDGAGGTRGRRFLAQRRR